MLHELQEFKELDIYRCKINEALSYVYSEQYFFKTSQEYIEKSLKLKGENVDAKFQLKHANFMKKSGFYSIALKKINKIPAQTDHYLKFRILRDKGRVLAILNRMTESMECF